MRYSMRELRAKNNWSQKDVAKKLGVSVQTYNAWESDFGCMKIKKANQLAKLFNVSLDDIFFSNILEENSSTHKCTIHNA